VKPEIRAHAEKLTKLVGGKISYTSSPTEAVKGAQVVATDTWSVVECFQGKAFFVHCEFVTGCRWETKPSRRSDWMTSKAIK
jgi:ornithine carbamoyltransferase